MSAKVELYKSRGETSRQVSAEVDSNGKLTLSACDLGKMPEEFFGDSDYEFWATVQPEHKDAVVLALIEQLYSGHDRAVDEFIALLKSRGIPYQFQSY